MSDVRCPLLMSDVKCPMSHVRWLLSDVWCPISDVWCPMSDVRYPISDVCCMISDVWFPVSDVPYPTSDVRCLISYVWSTMSDVRRPDVWFSMSDFRCPMSDVWCPMSDFWFPISDVRCLIFDVGCLMSDVSFVFGYGHVCQWSWNKRKVELTWDKKLSTTYVTFSYLFFFSQASIFWRNSFWLQSTRRNLQVGGFFRNSRKLLHLHCVQLLVSGARCRFQVTLMPGARLFPRKKSNAKMAAGF